MSPALRPDDILWLVHCYSRIAGVPPSANVEWIRPSKYAHPFSLREMVMRLVNDPRRNSLHAMDEWRADVAKLRAEVDGAIGWSDMPHPPREWTMWAREGAGR